VTNNYRIVEAPLETAPFTLMIYQIPESDLNDKLSTLAQLRGKISRDNYCNFLIFTCVSNKDTLLQYAKKPPTSHGHLEELKEEIMAKILGINPKLSPGNLFIDADRRVKKRNDAEQIRGTPLLDNKEWKDRLQ